MRGVACRLAIAGALALSACGGSIQQAGGGAGADAGSQDASLDAPPLADAAAEDAPAQACDGSAPDGGSAWLYDDCLWKPLPEPAKCDVFEARLPSQRFPKRAFTSCGDGCRVAHTSFDPGAQYGELWRGWYDGQASYVRVGSFVDQKMIHDVLDVTHNVSLAATQTRDTVTPPDWAQCLSLDTRPLGPVLVESWEHWTGDPTQWDNPSKTSFALVRYRQGPEYHVLNGTFDTPPNSSFDIGLLVAGNSSWGYAARTLNASTSFDHAPPLPAVAPAPGRFITDLTTWNDVYVWRDEDPDPSGMNIYTWSPAGGYHVLYHTDQLLVAVAVGSSGVVWASGSSNPDAGASSFDASLWWLPDPAASPAVPELVASHLGTPVNPTGIVTGDGLAALVTCSEVQSLYHHAKPSTCTLDVVELSSGKLHVYGSPTPSTFWANVVLINARELVVGEYDDAPYLDNQGASTRLFVLDTTQLDALESVFPAPSSDAGP